MSSQPEITQRDLRMRSKEIMDAVERGQAFTVTRDGHRIGELVHVEDLPAAWHDWARERAT